MRRDWTPFAALVRVTVVAVTGWRGGSEYVETLLDCMARWRALARQWMLLSEEIRNPLVREKLRGTAAAALFAAHEAELQFLRCCAVRVRANTDADTE